MRKYGHPIAATNELEALEARQYMSAATFFVSGLLRLRGHAAQNNTFYVRAVAGNSAIYARADSHGQVVPESGIKKIVIDSGDQTDTVSVNRNSPLSVEVVSAAGAVHQVDPGQTETFNGGANTSYPTHPTKGHRASSDGSTHRRSGGSSGSSASTGSGSSSSGSGSTAIVSDQTGTGSSGSSGSSSIGTSSGSSGSTGSGSSSGGSGSTASGSDQTGSSSSSSSSATGSSSSAGTSSGSSGTGTSAVTLGNTSEVSGNTTQVSVASFGAVGDGVTDDSAAIQAAIDSAPVGSTLTFTAGKTYLLNTGLVVNKAININGNGATLLLDTSAWPQNVALAVGSQLDSQSFTWTQSIAAGTQTFNVAVPTSDIAVGDKVFVSLGRDPYDDSQPNFGVIATVTQNTGSTITIDEPVPYSINQGDQPNSITKIDSLVQNITIQNLNFNYVPGTVTDADVWLSTAQNVTVENLSGKFTIAVQLTDSKNITVQNIQGTETNTHLQAGRAFSAWQSENVSVSNVDVSTAFDKAVFFLESWDRNISISNVQITDTALGPLHADLFHITGGTYGVTLNGISITDQAPIDFVDSGGEPGDYTMSNITINGPIRYFDVAQLTGLFTWNGVTYSDSNLPAALLG
jgi:Pectate lyase superfamily protein